MQEWCDRCNKVFQTEHNDHQLSQRGLPSQRIGQIVKNPKGLPCPSSESGSLKIYMQTAFRPYMNAKGGIHNERCDQEIAALHKLKDKTY